MRNPTILLLSVFFAAAPLQLRAGNMDDYPTVLRVEFVLECMREHTGSQYELMSKCSCVMDQLGKRMTAEVFVEARTTAQAITISGERGSVLRDNAAAHKMARSYNDSLGRARSDCFLRQPEHESTK